MGGHLERARVLHRQGRHDDAVGELKRELAREPESPEALVLLALSLSELERGDEALDAAREAVRQDPEWPFAHYALARVLYDRDENTAAERALDEALRLEPENASYHALRGALHIDAREWKRALRAAERGLSFDAEHVACLNLRSMALTQLGRRDEAHAGLDVALGADPDSSLSHANRGWTHLHAGEVRPALEHFSEALRLDPTDGWARSGLVEALKARNPIYRGVLSWYLFAGRLSGRVRTGILIGLFVGFRALRATLEANGLTWLAVAVALVYVSLVYLSWVAAPMFNLMLFLDPVGRHALEDDERRGALLFGGSIGLGLVLAGLTLAVGFPGDALLVAGAGLALSVPVAAATSMGPGVRRALTAAFCVVLACALVLAGLLHPLGIDAEHPLPSVLAVGVLGAAALSTWLFLFSRD